MGSQFTDLTYLERFCKGDRTRMERYVGMFLQVAPDQFAKLGELLQAGDAEGLAVTAHTLRPQVNYMGARSLFDRLTTLEHQARAEGAAACGGLVAEVLELAEKVMAELHAQPGQGT